MNDSTSSIDRGQPTCMLGEAVTSITQHSSSSHGGIGSRLTIDIKTRQLTGEISQLVDGEAVKTTVDRTLDEAEWSTFIAAFDGVCVPTSELSEPSTLGGGTVYWEARHGPTSTAFGLAVPLGPGVWWGQLTREQWDLLTKAWPGS